MGMKNLAALAVHPLMALATSLLFVIFATVNPNTETMDMALVASGGLILAGIAQAMGRKEMLSLTASPTNYGQTVALLGLAAGMAAYSQSGGNVIMGAGANLVGAIVFGVITVIEGSTRAVFMYKLHRYGSEKYAERRIARILKGRMCNWNMRIDNLIKISRGRSIAHDRHARDLAEAARRAVADEGLAAAC